MSYMKFTINSPPPDFGCNEWKEATQQRTTLHLAKSLSLTMLKRLSTCSAMSDHFIIRSLKPVYSIWWKILHKIYLHVFLCVVMNPLIPIQVQMLSQSLDHREIKWPWLQNNVLNVLKKHKSLVWYTVHKDVPTHKTFRNIDRTKLILSRFQFFNTVQVNPI